MDASEKKSRFWASFIRAVEAEPMEGAKSISGASGLDHPCIALGVDAARRRLIVISPEPDGRVAALVQADIQALNPDNRVIVARPIAVNLRRLGEVITTLLGRDSVLMSEIKSVPAEGSPEKVAFDERIKAVATLGLQPTIRAISFASLDWVPLVQEGIRQLSYLQLEKENPGSASDVPDNPILRLGPLSALDPAEVDRRCGVCFVPLYDFTESDAEHFHRGEQLDAVRDVLSRNHLLQFFFPAADQLALGLVERGRTPASSEALVGPLSRTAVLGHPLGTHELVSPETQLVEIVDALRDRGLLVEGEVGLELTSEGRAIRATVKYKPREGFLSKLASVVSLKVDVSLKDLWKPHGPA